MKRIGFFAEPSFKCKMLSLLWGWATLLDGLFLMLTFGGFCFSLSMKLSMKLSIERHYANKKVVKDDSN